MQNGAFLVLFLKISIIFLWGGRKNINFVEACKSFFV